MTYWSRFIVIWRGFGSFWLEGRGLRRLQHLLLDDLLAQVDALVADVDALARDELADLLLALAAERAAIRDLRALGTRRRHRHGSCATSPLPDSDLRPSRRPPISGTRAAGQRRIVRLRDQRVTRQRVDRVDDAISLGLLGRHEIVPVRVLDHLLQRLASVLGQDLVVALDEVLPLAHLDHGVGSVASEAARALVDHDPAVGQRIALARRAGGQQHGRHRGRHADADRADRCPQVLHRVVDREAGVDDAAGRVDVQADVLLGVLGLEEQQLGDDEVGEVILDRVAEEDDPLAKQARVDVVRAFPATGGFDDHRDEHRGSPLGSVGHRRHRVLASRWQPGGHPGRWRRWTRWLQPGRRRRPTARRPPCAAAAGARDGRPASGPRASPRAGSAGACCG